MSGSSSTLRVIWGGLAVIAVSAAILTFTSVQHLAVMCGYGEKVAWLLPVCLDVTAGVATAGWLGVDSPAVSRFARGLAWAALGLSVAANGLEHGLVAYGSRPVWWVVVLVSAVPPAVLGAVVHLLVLTTRQVPTDQSSATEMVGETSPVEGPGGEGEDEGAAQAAPSSSLPPAVSPNPPARVQDEDDEEEQVARLREIARQLGRMPGRDAVKAEFGCGSGRANRLRDKASKPALALATEVS